MYLKTLQMDEIHPYERNPRINDNAVEPVMKSIQKDGYRARIIVDTNGVIIAGHTRYKAMQRLGWTEAEVWIADDMTEEQIRDYRVRDNYTAGFADWDFDLLPGEIEGLDFDMSEFGMGDGGEEPPEPEAIEDNFDEEDIPEESDIKYGDVFLLGRHRLVCGDSTNIDDVKKLMDGAQADLFLTDPPYNVDYHGSSGMTIANDSMEDSAFRAFLTDAFSNANLVMRPGAAVYIWHADSEGFNFRAALREVGWKLRQTLIWVKNAPVLGRQDYLWRHEPCLYTWKEGTHYFTSDRTNKTVFDDRIDIKKLKKEEMRALLEKIFADKVPTTVLYEDKPLVNDLHPTMKPIRLMARLITNSSQPGWRVLDLFGGSGSTLMACEQLGRTCYTMELSPTYCSAIIKRFIKFTGEDVFLLQDGEKIQYIPED